MRNSFVLVTALLITTFLAAQTLDTIKIHRPLLFGIHYHKCCKIWFGYNGGFSYSETTKQDEVIANDTSYYFQVYGYTNKILFEGKKGNCGALYGEVKFYYKSGRIKKT